MKCLACQSDDISWISTIMEDEETGYEVYTCHRCGSKTEYEIRLVNFVYTGKYNVCPVEQE